MSDWELGVPFVACRTQGGPYDDDSFVAGFQAGRIDARLTVASVVGANHVVEVAYTRLRKQIDLLAMSHGYTVDPVVDREWTTYSFLLDVEEPPED